MNVAENLLDELAPPGVDHRELLGWLRRFFVSCTIKDNGDLLYPATAQYSLKVHGTSSRIARIEPGPGLRRDRLDDLMRDVRTNLLQSPGDTIGRVVAFISPVPLRGSHFAPDAQVQLSDAPPAAPRPNTLHGDHPMLIEFRMRRSADGMVTSQRRLRLGTEWAWVLNALLRGQVSIPGPRPQKHWVIDWQPAIQGRLISAVRGASHRLTRGRLPRVVAPEQHSVKWLQEYYDFPGWAAVSDSFSPVGDQMIVVPHDQYYSRDYRRAGDVAEVPKSIDRLLSSAAALSPEHRERYMRAATWLHAAGTLWDVHTSAWFLSLVAAIESLMPAPTERCPECRAWRYVTRRFRDFVERYAPNSEHSGRNAIYDMRSRLAHGSSLMGIDDAPWSFGARMDIASEYSTVDHLVLVVRELMMNWLQEHAALGAQVDA